MSTPRLALAVVAAAAAAAAVFFTAFWLAATPEEVLSDDLVATIEPASSGEDVRYTLEDGASASDIGSDLEELGVIRSGSQFALLVDLMGVGDQLQVAEYVFPRGLSGAGVISRMVEGNTAPQITLTFPEGIRIEEMADIVAASGFATREEFLEAVDNAEPPPGLAALIPEGAGLQGFLFPDTYFVDATQEPDVLVDLMLVTMNQRFNGALRQAAIDLGLTPYEAITLAAIIEREAVLPGERARISGVFHNRLENNDLLGADPTVQYVASLDPANVAEWGYWKPGNELTVDEFEDPNPYNTREIPGLPPGPITNPGLASIQAAVKPEETDFYFFVANDVAGDGRHEFAVTQEEHDANIAMYQR